MVDLLFSTVFFLMSRLLFYKINLLRFLLSVNSKASGRTLTQEVIGSDGSVSGGGGGA